MIRGPRRIKRPARDSSRRALPHPARAPITRTPALNSRSLSPERQASPKRRGRQADSATNRAVGPAWSESFNDSVVAVALLDRLLHRCTLLQVDGQSYRMRTHRAQVEALRRTITAAPPPGALVSQEEVVASQPI